MIARRILSVLFLLSAFLGAAQSRVTVGLGHSGAVRAVAGRTGLDLAFSVGTDGKLIVWDLEHDAARRTWQISQNPVTHIALHPDRNEAVVYVQDGVTSGRLIGLNWETGEEVFAASATGRPNYLEYSPQGSYVVYTVPSFDSVFFLNARTGSRLRFLDDGFGVVSFVQMARAERNAMTYVPSRGEFIYWQLQTGTELQTVSTERRLEHLTLIDPQTQRFIAASDGRQLVIVDNLTGEIRATYPAAPIHGIAFDAQTNRILVLVEQQSERSVLAFTYASGRLRRDFYRPQNLTATTSVLTPVGSDSTRGLLGGTTDGELAFYDNRTGRRTILGPSAITPIEAIAFTPGRVHLSIGNEIVSLVSDLFDEERRDVAASFIRESRIAPTDFTDLRMSADGGRLLLWGSHEPGTVWQLEPPSGTLTVVYDDQLDVPIARVKAGESGPLVIHRDGRIVQVGRDESTERFRYTAVGTQDAIWHPQLGLIAAKTRASAFDSAVIVVDQLTGETVAAETDAFLTTRLALDSRSNTLFAVGLHGSPAAPLTRLVELTGTRFGESRTIHETPLELSRGDVVWDSLTGSLLSSLDYQTVRRYTGRRESTLGRAEHLHTDLTAGANLVVARNLDGSASVWNRTTGEHLVDFYILDDEWIAISAVGTFMASSRAAESYLGFLPAERTRLTLEDFRVTTPLRLE